MDLTFEKCKTLAERPTSGMPEYKRWYDEAVKTAGDKREVRTFRGHVRYLYDSERDSIKQTLNTPIQGGAAHVVNEAMIRLHERIRDEALPMKMICQIHDELVFEVPEGVVKKMVKIVTEEMTRPLDYRGRIVSFPVEVKTGKRWGSLKQKGT
jgi:DNA polymerase I-like protein with 3'-5' exonuclease and polymerase domains